MSDLISRADAIEALYKSGLCYNNWLEVRNEIDALPSAEAVQIPIKLEKRYPESKDEDITDAFMRGYLAGRSSAEAVQGEWIITKEGEYDGRSVYKTVCSECGHETFYKANKAHFCPNCGARMEGADDED